MINSSEQAFIAVSIQEKAETVTFKQAFALLNQTDHYYAYCELKVAY